MKRSNKARMTAMAMSVLMAASLMPVSALTPVAAAETAEQALVFPSVYSLDLVQPDTDDAEVEAKVDALVAAMTTEEKYTFLGGNGTGDTEGNAGYLKGVGRLGIPQIKMYDGPAGVLFPEDTTNPPQEQLLAATWSENMAKLYGETVGKENVDIGGAFLLGAQLDIQRIPQFGRTKDQMGEDSYLLSSMADDLVNGMQEYGGIAVLKHYAAFTQNATPAADYNDVVSEQALHETYLAGFESAVKNGNALGLMSSYNWVNGAATSADPYLLIDVLRDMWGYKYFTVTDWGGNDGYTLNKGTEIEMPSLSNNSQANTQAQVEAGNMTQEEADATVDEAVKRVLRAYGEGGYLTLVQLDDDGNVIEGTVEGGGDYIKTVDVATSKAALEEDYDTSNSNVETVAEEGIVLLKNEDDVLPLDTSDDNTVAMIGLGAMNLISGHGGERSYGAVSAMTSPYEELVNIVGEDKVDGEVYEDIIGETIPAENLYTTIDGTENGVTRTYGVQASSGSSFSFQGQTQNEGKVEYTLMGDHEFGEYCTTDSTIEFVTNGRGNYTNDAEGGTALDRATSPAYTWTTYLEAPEDGTYSINFNNIGGSGNMKIYSVTTNEAGETVETQIGSANTASGNQGTQYYSSTVPTKSGMTVSSASVTLTKGTRYKVVISDALYKGGADRDMQLQLAWITPSQKQANIDGAMIAAETCDTSVVFVNNTCSDPGSSIETTSLKLDDDQQQLILDVAEKAHENGHKVVVVLQNSNQVVMEDWIDEVDGIVEMYYPGQRGGVAIANILSGKVNPSGKLAWTIPAKDTDTIVTYSEDAFARYEVGEGEPITNPFFGKMYAKSNTYYDEGINTGYKWFDSMDIEPAYDFGYGLSYTSFAYSDFHVKEAENDGESIGYDVTFTVTNTGDVAGKEVAQVYLGQADIPQSDDPDAVEIQSAEYALAGYQKTEELQPGESQKITIHVTERTLSYWNTNQKELNVNEDGTKDKWTVAEGVRKIVVASSEDEDDFQYSQLIDVEDNTAEELAAKQFVKNTAAISSVRTLGHLALVSAKAIKNATKYQFRYVAANKLTSLSSLKKNLKSVSSTSRRVLLVLKKGKYYVQTRAYETIGGKKVYTKWSSIKSFTLK